MDALLIPGDLDLALKIIGAAGLQYCCDPAGRIWLDDGADYQDAMGYLDACDIEYECVKG